MQQCHLHIFLLLTITKLNRIVQSNFTANIKNYLIDINFEINERKKTIIIQIDSFPLIDTNTDSVSLIDTIIASNSEFKI
jgi:hypothetical protein